MTSILLYVYIVGCRSDYRDNLILSSPVIRNKTFDGALKFYYYCKLGYIIIHFVKLVFYWILEWMSLHPRCLNLFIVKYPFQGSGIRVLGLKGPLVGSTFISDETKETSPFWRQCLLNQIQNKAMKYLPTSDTAIISRGSLCKAWS